MQKALFYKKEVRPYQKSKSSKNQNYKYIHSVLFQLPGHQLGIQILAMRIICHHDAVYSLCNWGDAMYIRQSDLLMGTSMDFVKKVMDTCQMVSHEKGETLFRENDEARCFYILLSGRVELRAGKDSQVVYDVGQNGEAFGWSSLIGRDVYSASAECVEQSKLLVSDRTKLNCVLEEDPANGIIFMKHLAATLGNRLMETYKSIPSSSG